MGKPFDVSKFRKEITKSIDGLSIGFNDPTDWINRQLCIKLFDLR
jgi:hypothetical protein